MPKNLVGLGSKYLLELLFTEVLKIYNVIF
jgi:hypothetical protein